MAYLMIALSLGAFAVAAMVLRSMIVERKANADRLARAIHPQHGRSVLRDVKTYRDRLGE